MLVMSKMLSKKHTPDEEPEKEKTEHQEALEAAGYDSKLEYEEVNLAGSEKRNRSRKGIT